MLWLLFHGDEPVGQHMGRSEGGTCKVASEGSVVAQEQSHNSNLSEDPTSSIHCAGRDHADIHTSAMTSPVRAGTPSLDYHPGV